MGGQKKVSERGRPTRPSPEWRRDALARGDEQVMNMESMREGCPGGDAGKSTTEVCRRSDRLAQIIAGRPTKGYGRGRVRLSGALHTTSKEFVR